MIIKLLWPGKMKSPAAAALQAHYLQRISGLNAVRLLETPTPRGMGEKEADKIMALEAAGLKNAWTTIILSASLTEARR